MWEAAPHVPGERVTAAMPASVSMKVMSMDGAPVFAGVSGPAGREAVVMPTGASLLTFDAPPGVLLVQMEILDAAGRTLDRDVRDLVVGGFPGPLSFGTPAVYRARTAVELRAIVSAGNDAAPVAARQFSRAEHLVIRIPVVARSAVTPPSRCGSWARFGVVLRELPTTTIGARNEVAQVTCRWRLWHRAATPSSSCTKPRRVGPGSSRVLGDSLIPQFCSVHLVSAIFGHSRMAAGARTG